jgi:hypothetical protein
MYQGRLEPSSCQRPRHAWIGSDGIRASGPLLGAAGVVCGFVTGFGGGGTLVFLAPGT